MEQDQRGTYVLNSRDLRLIQYIPQLAEAGLSSLKIEGRMKSIAYVATVVNAYRMALDAYGQSLATGTPYQLDPDLLQELERASHRPYTTGFALGLGATPYQAPESAAYIGEGTIGAVVLSYDPRQGRAAIEQRNKFALGDTLSILSPGDVGRTLRVEGLWDLDGAPRAGYPPSPGAVAAGLPYSPAGRGYPAHPAKGIAPGPFQSPGRIRQLAALLQGTIVNFGPICPALLPAGPGGGTPYPRRPADAGTNGAVRDEWAQEKPNARGIKNRWAPCSPPPSAATYLDDPLGPLCRMGQGTWPETRPLGTDWSCTHIAMVVK